MKGRFLNECKRYCLLGAVSSLLFIGLCDSLQVEASFVPLFDSNNDIECDNFDDSTDSTNRVQKISKGVNIQVLADYLESDEEQQWVDVRDEIVEYALSFVGNKYVLGGNSLEKGTDCSGFTRLIYGEYGYSIGKVANDQYRNIKAISFEDLKPGDLVFYGRKGHASHVAMYIGDGRIVHAANSKRGITTDDITYMKNTIGYGRVFSLEES